MFYNIFVFFLTFIWNIFFVICFVLVACILLSFSRSVTFMGLQRAEERRVIEAECAGVDMAKLTGLLREAFFKSVTLPLGLLGPPDEVADRIVRAFPRLHVGHSLRWYCAVQYDSSRPETRRYPSVEIRALRVKALDVAREYPVLNKPFASLLPPANFPVLVQTSASSVVPLMQDVWTCVSPYFGKEKRGMVLVEGLETQATIIRNKKGELMIVNPVTFNPASADYINRLGTVTVIVNSSPNHKDGVAHCHALWPSAKLYGSKSKQKTELPWTTVDLAQNPDQKRLFEADWQCELCQLEGQAFRELYLFFRNHRLLTGPTDTAISTEMTDDISYGLRLYKAFLGVCWPRNKSIGIQSYNNWFINDYEALSRSAETILGKWDYDFIVLGHGGLITAEVNGLTAKQQLRQAFEPVLVNHPSFPVRIGLIIRFLYHTGVLSLIRSYFSFYVIPKCIDRLLMREKKVSPSSDTNKKTL